MSSVVGKLVQLGAGGEVDRSFDVADKELVIGRWVPESENVPASRGTRTRARAKMASSIDD